MKIQSPWMGRIKGSAGNMTGCKVYDKNVMRAKAFEVSNPNTSAQQVRREFFSTALKVSSSVSEEQLRSLFGQKPKAMSRRNALTKQLMDACFGPPVYLNANYTTVKLVGDTEMSIETALGFFQPSQYDRIIDPNDDEAMYQDGEWSGDFTTLQPNTKYTYYNDAGTPRLLSGSEDYFDFSQLQAIGNGEKINVPIGEINSGDAEFFGNFTETMVSQGANENQNIILVCFDTSNKRIVIVNLNNWISDYEVDPIFDVSSYGISKGYFYPTFSIDGKNVADQSFGSFIIKTRKEKVGRLAPQIEVIS